MIFTWSWPAAVVVLLGLHWALPARWRDGFLAVGSIAYLLGREPLAVAAYVLLSVAAFLAAPRPGTPRKAIGPALILGLLAILAWFKYVPPLLAGLHGGSLADLAIPIGLSYFTFKLIHWVVETSRGNLTDRSLGRFLCWLFLLPTFTAGPIERFDHFLENREDRPRRASFAEGGTRILYGLVKKVILVEILATPLRRIGGSEMVVARLPDLPPIRVWGLVILQYLRFYIEFSAYTDLAVGTSRLFGIGIMENFRWPVLARNVGDFWSRWHRSLSGWCQSYIYMPVIGLTRNPHVAAYATFLGIGLWHAGALPFVAWGLYHGTGVAVYRAWRRRRPPAPHPTGLRAVPGIAATFLFVSASFALTMPYGTGTAGDGLRIFLRLFGVDA